MNVREQTFSISEASFLALGIVSASFGIRGFLIPGGLVDGGVTGLCMIAARVTDLPLSVLIVLFNIPFLLLAYIQIGKRFSLVGAVGIFAFATFLHFLPWPAVTRDLLLSAVFGGIFLGAGIGLAIRGGGVLDGTEIFALFTSRRSTFRVGDIILLMNILIFGLAATIIGLELTMYSLLTYFSATRTVDFLLYGIEEYNGVIIISRETERIRSFIIDELHRGVTVLAGRGGYEKSELEMLFCVLTRLELPKIRTMVRKVDEDAFLVNFTIKDAIGGRTRRRVDV